MSNVAVNTIVYGVSAWRLAKFGRFVGLFFSISIVGTALGTVAGYLLGLGINYLMDLEINGKSLIDHIRDFVYDSWKSILD